MKLEMQTTVSFAKEVDERLLQVRCPHCKRFLSVTVYEVRSGHAVPCPSCEAWVPLWNVEGVFQDLYEMALSVDRSVTSSCH